MSFDESRDICGNTFRRKYGALSVALSVPGRANIIGEHTDYNQGFVLPFAINRYIHFAAKESLKECSRIYSVNFQEEVILENNKVYSGFGGFLNSCLAVLKDENRLTGSFDLVFGGDLPIGGGMSSSSAMCCGFVAVMSHLFNLSLSPQDILRIVIKAEKGVSVDGGIMDQFSIINGKKDHAILLDCLDNSVQYIPLNLDDYCFCLIDSGVSHNLQETAYDQRVLTCKAALNTLKSSTSRITGFRDIKLEDLAVLTPLQKKRIKHVIEENGRVHKAVQSLKLNDFNTLGRLLDQSHVSLRDGYEVSCEELDLIVELLRKESGCLGARMMGGGFGGSVISLMKANEAESIITNISERYKASVGIDLIAHMVRSSDGLSAMS